MIRNISGWLLLIGLLNFGPTLASDYVIEGTVTEIHPSQGVEPLRNVDVYLYSASPPKNCPDSGASTNFENSTLSDKDGNYRFTELEAIDYYVHFCRDGYSLHPREEKRDPSQDNNPLLVSLSDNDGQITVDIGYSIGGSHEQGWASKYIAGISASISSRYHGLNVQPVSDISKIADGTAQVLVSDRYLTAKDLGIGDNDSMDVQVSVIAAAPVHVFVHEQNEISGFTFDQVADILCTDADAGTPRWDDLGVAGWDSYVNVYAEELSANQIWTNWWGQGSRPDQMGSWTHFPVFNQSNCSARTTGQGDFDFTYFANDLYGVGFVGHATYSQTSRPMAVRPMELGWDAAHYYPAEPEYLFSGEYPLTRNVYVYSIGTQPALARLLTEEIETFSSGQEGRKILAQGGFSLPTTPLQIPILR